MRTFIATTIRDLLQHFSFRKYGIALVIIFITCFINYYSSFHLWLKGEHFLFSVSWYSLLFFLFLLAGIIIEGTQQLSNKQVRFIIIVAPVLFALKVAVPFLQLLPVEMPASYKQSFQQPIAWLGGVLFMSAALLSFYRLHEGNWGLYAVKKTQSLRSYFLLIVLMIPLLLWASMQKDFSAVYPRAKIITETIGADAKAWHYMLFEAAYVADFISIELFFRGFLIIILGKLLGKQCILPIALFYFSIHLGKPMFEAISSFFGGIILGTISYRSKSIWGGWLVHVSIALLMELFGYLF